MAYAAVALMIVLASAFALFQLNSLRNEQVQLNQQALPALTNTNALEQQLGKLQSDVTLFARSNALTDASLYEKRLQATVVSIANVVENLEKLKPNDPSIPELSRQTKM